jgi:hypothetical protein
MAIRFISDLVGTLKGYFVVQDVQIKDDAGIVALRDADDTAYAGASAKEIELYGQNVASVKLTTVSGATATTYAFDDADGAAEGYVLTLGAGNRLYPAAPTTTAGMERVQQEIFDQSTSSPLTIFTPPANALITMVQIEVTGAASGNSASVSVGISGDEDRDMDETDVNLKKAALFEVEPNTDVGGTPEAIILTVTPGSETFSGEVRVWYSIPQ